MTVFHRIVKLKSKNLQGEIDKLDKYLLKHPGIDYVILQNTPAIETLVIEFITSDKNPGADHEHTDKDIEAIIKDSGINVTEELKEHKNDPLKKANHLVRISDEDNNELERA